MLPQYLAKRKCSNVQVQLFIDKNKGARCTFGTGTALQQRVIDASID